MHPPSFGAESHCILSSAPRAYMSQTSLGTARRIAFVSHESLASVRVLCDMPPLVTAHMINKRACITRARTILMLWVQSCTHACRMQTLIVHRRVDNSRGPFSKTGFPSEGNHITGLPGTHFFTESKPRSQALECRSEKRAGNCCKCNIHIHTHTHQTDVKKRVPGAG